MRCSTKDLTRKELTRAEMFREVKHSSLSQKIVNYATKKILKIRLSGRRIYEEEPDIYDSN